jgi:hypothetical protein
MTLAAWTGVSSRCSLAIHQRLAVPPMKPEGVSLRLFRATVADMPGRRWSKPG